MIIPLVSSFILRPTQKEAILLTFVHILVVDSSTGLVSVAAFYTAVSLS
jgi:hypothetical protein